MRPLADESLTGSIRQFLQSSGHELLTLNVLGRLGATNGEVLALAKTHDAILVTEDRGLGSLPDYPLGSHAGIVVLKIHSADDIEAVQGHLAEALKTLPPDQLAGALLIVDRTKFRLRRPT